MKAILHDWGFFLTASRHLFRGFPPIFQNFWKFSKVQKIVYFTVDPTIPPPCDDDFFTSYNGSWDEDDSPANYEDTDDFPAKDDSYFLKLYG